MTNYPTSRCPDPSIYYAVPFEEYASWPAVNNSSLGPLLKSPAHYKYAMTHPTNEEKPAWTLGSFLHAGVLNPAATKAGFYVLPDFENDTANVTVKREKPKNPKATAYYKKTVAEYRSTRTALSEVTEAQLDQTVGMAKTLYDSEKAQALLKGALTEVSIVWDDPDTGIRCKARLDAWHRSIGTIPELKTCRDPQDFVRLGLINLHYYRQSAFYRDGLRVLTGQPCGVTIIVVDPMPLHYALIAPVDKDTLAAGREEYRCMLQTIAACRKSGKWPGPPDPESWSLPEWKLPPVELVIGGKTVTI